MEIAVSVNCFCFVAVSNNKFSFWLFIWIQVPELAAFFGFQPQPADVVFHSHWVDHGTNHCSDFVAVNRNFRNMFFRSWTAPRKAGWRTENLQLFWKTIPLQCPAPQSSDTMMKNSLIFREQANEKWNNPQTDNRRFIR